MTHHHSAFCTVQHQDVTVPVNHSNAPLVLVFLSPPFNNAAPTLKSGAQPHKSLTSQFKPGLSHLSLHSYNHPHPHDPLLSNFLPSFQVKYIPADKVPDKETNTKQVVPRLIDRLARHAMQPARKKGYIKFATIFGHIADARTSWTVDVFVGSISSINTDYIDKLNWSSSPSLPFLIPSAWVCSTRQFICLLLLIYSSGRPPYPRCQRKFLP